MCPLKKNNNASKKFYPLTAENVTPVNTIPSPLGFQYRNSTHASGVFEEYIYEKISLAILLRFTTTLERSSYLTYSTPWGITENIFGSIIIPIYLAV